tara:strand:- start:526 stop:1020 length:495 start_codon:yes stop_codon:yes gene_type:complete
MKYIKLFEEYNKNNFFDSKKYKGTIVFRGMDSDEFHKAMIGESIGYFFSENKNFTNDYGGYIIQAVLDTDNVFNSLDDRNIIKLFEEGFELYDNHSDTTFKTYNEYIDSNIEYSDTWDIIENSDGVLEWIMSNYDACYITEGGQANYYINQPFKYLKDIKELIN